MKVLITGIAGLIGARFADWLHENKPEIEILGIDDLSGGYIENVPASVKFYQRNVLTDSLSDIFSQGIDFVFHFAAYAAEGLSPFIRTFNYQNNTVASARLISLSIEYQVKRFVFTSSIAVYGKGKPPFSENDYPVPLDPYGVAKLAVERDLAIAYDQHGLEYCIVRPHNVYGEKQNIWDKYRNVFGIWMLQILNQKPITVYGSGSQKRAFTYINDILRPLWNAATLEKSGQQIINIGSSHETSIIEAARTLLTVTQAGEICHLPSRHEVELAWCRHDKAKEILGYADKTSLESGLTTMWQWALRQPRREQKEWTEYELNKGMYDFWKKENASS